MNSFATVVLFALLGASSAQVQSSGSCPSVSVVTNFDVISYLGVWYEYARYFSPFEVDSKCNQAEYTLNDDGSVSVVNSQRSTITGQPDVITGTATLDSNNGEAKLTVNFPSNSSPLWILGTDYNNYSVAYTCVESNNNGVVTKSTSVFILTRESPPSTDAINNAYNVLNANGIDRSLLIFSDQNC